MKIFGIMTLHSLKNKAQYKTIAQLWDIFEKLFPVESIVGVGLNWTDESMEYFIGIKKIISRDIQNEILKKIPNAIFSWYDIENISNMEVYRGNYSTLQSDYEKIWRKKVIQEIETFQKDGNYIIYIKRGEE